MTDLFALSSAETSTFREVGLPKELWDHQRAALEYIVRARRVFLADEVGVGKTAVALAAVRLLNSFPVLVVPPAYLRYNWQRAIDEWLPGMRIRVVEPGENLGDLGFDFYIVSYNLLGQRDKEKKVGLNPLAKELMKRPLKAIICDESHALKTTTSFRQKAVRKIALGVPTRILIGANPLESKPKELIPQLDILDQLGQFHNAWSFLQRYCNRYGENERSRNKFQKWDFSGARNLVELNHKLRSSCLIQRDKTQVHKSLPPLTQALVHLPITNRAEYTQAENDFANWLTTQSKEEELSALRAPSLVRLAVLKRLASEGKRAAAEDWINGFLEDNPNQQLVVFTYLRETAEYFSVKLNAPAIIGGTSITKREEFIAAFQAKRTRVIIVNVAAGGTGIELYAASNCVFLELDWLPTTHSQAAGRLHRPGQENPVTAWWLLGDGTVEQRIYSEILLEKARVVHDTLKGVDAAGADRGADLLDQMLKGMLPEKGTPARVNPENPAKNP